MHSDQMSWLMVLASVEKFFQLAKSKREHHGCDLRVKKLLEIEAATKQDHTHFSKRIEKFEKPYKHFGCCRRLYKNLNCAHLGHKTQQL